MIRITVLVLVSALLGACASGPDIIRPIPIDSVDYPKDPAVLNMPLSLMLVSVDSQVQQTALVNTDPYEIHLKPGPHRIEFHYSMSWGGANFGETIDSGVMVVELVAEPGQIYFLEYQRPRSEKEALNMEKGFDAWVEDPVSGGKYNATYQGKFRSGINALIYNATVGGTAAAPIPPATMPVAVAASSKEVVAVPIQNVVADVDAKPVALQDMKGWWRQATKVQRQEFLNWALIEKNQ